MVASFPDSTPSFLSHCDKKLGSGECDKKLGVESGNEARVWNTHVYVCDRAVFVSLPLLQIDPSLDLVKDTYVRMLLVV